MTVVLGLNGQHAIGHDAAAALVREGRLLAAVEEERLARVKRAYGLPPLRSMREVLDISGISFSDVDVVAYPWLPEAMGVDPAELMEQMRSWFTEAGFPRRPELEIRFIEHHLAHAWCGMAFMPERHRGHRVGVLVLDGSGESTSGACYVINDEFNLVWNLAQDSSLGIYYEAASQYIGFSWGEEGKTMGLASFGCDAGVRVPKLLDRRSDRPLTSTRYRGESPRHVHESLRAKLIGDFQRLNGDHLSFRNRADVALAAQQLVSDRVLKYAAELMGSIDVLVVSGGIALNCTINSSLAALCREGGVELVVAPPASDTGVAIGAAVAAFDSPSSIPTIDPFLGRMFDPDEIARQLHEFGVHTKPLEIKELASDLVERSLVCGWFEGRSEVGPRALGKRSILARPDVSAVRDRINLLKRRESWRPLAPSVSEQEFVRSFGGSEPSPYMLIMARVLPTAAHNLLGVTHVDDTSRPQVVGADGAYRDLLAQMGKATGTEAVICTSFNAGGEPIVYSPAHALQSARAIGLDALAGDGWCAPL